MSGTRMVLVTDEPARMVAGIRALLAGTDAETTYAVALTYLDANDEPVAVADVAERLVAFDGVEQILFADGFTVPLRRVVAFGATIDHDDHVA